MGRSDADPHDSLAFSPAGILGREAQRNLQNVVTGYQGEYWLNNTDGKSIDLGLISIAAE